MAALSQSESRRKYSWWWDSHNSPKNSKWLQENLTDMDVKVKSMIKLIEEDADSFARRAEMYYKKRPELMKLVEEFYRAYRALAERYNHATCELRHAHRTIAKAFPDHQIPFDLIEDSPSKPSVHGRDPRTPEAKFPIRVLFEDNDDDDDDDDLLDGLPESVEKEGSIRLLNDKGEVQALEKALFDMRVEKENALLKYQQCLEKLSNMEAEVSDAQRNLERLNEKAGRAEIDARTLREVLVQLEAEKKDGLIKHEECLGKISDLESMLFQIRDEAESESRALKDGIFKLELENEELLRQHKECLEKISVLENEVSVSENVARLLKKKAETTENEVFELKKALADLNEEKEGSVTQYKCYLEKISKLERELFVAKEDVKRLNNDLLIGNLKFKTVEKKYTLLEMTNLSLRTEAENLAKKIANKDRELTKKQEELENLMTHFGDEHSRHVQIEATLDSLRNLHSQSQDDQRALAVEIESLVQRLKDSEVNKEFLQGEIRHVRDENLSLAELNLSSANSMENMQNEILGLREIKERLENEVSNHVGLSDSLHREISQLKEEIKGLKESYQAIIKQVEVAGLSPDNFAPSIKTMQDENEVLSKKLEKAESLLMEKSVSENFVLASSQEEVKVLHESCRSVEGEKAALAAEKASLLSQLETITVTMHKLLENNAVLENSLSAAKVELEGLREKSKGLEEICELLKNERSFLLTERGSLASKLENVERRLKNMEKRYNGLDKKYADLEKEKHAATCQVEELKICLSAEKQQQTSSKLQSDSKLVGLKNKIRFLQDENSQKKKEFEEELERSLKAQFEISILQKFMKEMEEKNCSLVIECQKHVEASKLAEKLISELESESLEQQVESEILLDEIEWLRLSVYRIFKALETGSDSEEEEDKIENERDFANRVLENIEDLKCSVSKHEDDKQLLLVENSVLLTLLEQLESKGLEIESEKAFLEKEIKAMAGKLEMAEKVKGKLSESNEKLEKEANVHDRNFAILETETENLREKEISLRKDYNALEEAYLHANRDKEDLMKKFRGLKEEKHLLDHLHDSALMEYIAATSQSEILRVYSEERISEQNIILDDLRRQAEVNSGLKEKMRMFMEKFELQESRNIVLKECLNKLEREMIGMRETNLQTEEKLSDTRARLKAAENLNVKLCKTVDELESDIHETIRVKENLEKDVFKLSDINSAQKLEIESLHMDKTGLKSELGQLRDEIEDKISKERFLCSDLEEKNNELKLWEAEALGFYFDLQISAVDGVLYRNKLQELAGVYPVLEEENSSKRSEIDGMKGRIFSMESEISGLKSQLRAYGPVVDALRDDITVLEHNALLQKKVKSSRNHEQEVSEATVDPSRSSSEILPEDNSLVSLQSLHTRIQVVGKLMQETNKPTLHRRSTSRKHRDEPATGAEIEKPVRCLGRDRVKTKSSESRNPTMLMKDIPLDQISNTNNAPPKRLRKRGGSTNNSQAEGDQMLELWEKAAEPGRHELTIGESLKLSSFKMTEKDIIAYAPRTVISDPPSADSDLEQQELGVDSLDFLPRKSTENERRILDRLNSDSAKLENLQMTARIMREKMEETNGTKSRKSKKDVDLETVWEQFLEAEETIEYLVELNGQLVRSMESCPSPDRKSSSKLKEAVRVRRRKVSEQAKKGSERIGRLQLELQKIQYVLVKMEEEKKSKGKSLFFRNKTVVLSDFIYNGRKISGKRKKGPLCCFRPSSSGSNGQS